MASLFNGGSISSRRRNSVPTLPFELIEEILYRLPVKLLLQLRCVCKSWNSTISDPIFVRKHLSHSTTLALHFLTYFNPSRKFILTSHPMHTVVTNVTTNFTQLEYPQDNSNGYRHLLTGLDCFVGSCHGLLCLTNCYGSLVLVWNPSIRKINELPRFEKSKPSGGAGIECCFAFGYDHVNDDYKVVLVLSHDLSDDWRCKYVVKTEVKVHTLGTDYWKSIPEFPFGGVSVMRSGQFVSGTINWLAYNNYSYWKGPSFIISFDLEKESYQQILQPDYEDIDASAWQLGVLKDCMWVISGNDVWLMKEYGNRESWTKLFTVSCDFEKVINILEDDQVLLETMEKKMIVYNFKNHTFKFTEFEFVRSPVVGVESLISPFS